MRTSPSRGRSAPSPPAKEGGAVKRIALIEDDADIAYTIRLNLRKEKRYQVEHYVSGLAALAALQEKPFDLVVLDLNLPDIDGLALCRELRRADETRRVPIIMLTARVEEADRLIGLELGADDYITKPFSPRELLARVRAAVRRSSRQTSSTAQSFGDVSVDFAKMEVIRAGQAVTMTAQEFKVLKFLMENAERVVSREELLNEVWGYQNYPSTRTVDNHILKLRQKLEADPAQPIHFRTMHGAGYKFVP